MVNSLIIKDDIAYVNEDPANVPDIGSWKASSIEADGKKTYIGLETEVAKLPDYAKLGSLAFAFDSGEQTFNIYMKAESGWEPWKNNA